MKIKIIYIIVFALLISEAAAFSKKNYYNYNREAVSDFIWGIFSEQLSNTDGVKKYYEKSFEDSRSDYIRHDLALQLIRSGQKEEGYKILNDLYDKGFKLGRSGIFLYLTNRKTKKKQDQARYLTA